MLGLPDILGNPGTGTGIFDVMGKFVACLYHSSLFMDAVILIHDFSLGMMWGPDGSQCYPGLASAWCRTLLGWVHLTVIKASGK
jgi:hypothetical protein